eukprot:COSAG02_NODE_5667_length_4143_cov_1.935955_2_plen_77_part_00
MPVVLLLLSRGGAWCGPQPLLTTWWNVVVTPVIRSYDRCHKCDNTGSVASWWARAMGMDLSYVKESVVDQQGVVVT